MTHHGIFHVFSVCFAEEEQETVVDHFEMQRAGPDELIFAQHEVGDCAVLSCETGRTISRIFKMIVRRIAVYKKDTRYTSHCEIYSRYSMEV